MEIRLSETAWEFAEMEPFAADLFRTLPECASDDGEAARARIFGTPTDGDDPEADEDWREQVEPDLAELFKSHLDVVAGDLANMRETDGTFTLTIPVEHARAWIHTFNQARLALGARHDITEHDMAARHEHSGDKAGAIMRIDFYGEMLGLMLSQTAI